MLWSDNALENNLYFANADGSFTEAAEFGLRHIFLGRSDGAIGCFIADYNGDGRDDILCRADNPVYNRLLISRGNGYFGIDRNFNITDTCLAQSNNNTGCLAADFNGDGMTDLLRWSNNYIYNRLYFSSGNGDFSAPTTFNIKDDYLGKADNSYRSFAGDFNGDGKPDILRCSTTAGRNKLYYSRRDGSFETWSSFNLANVLLWSTDGTVRTAAGGDPPKGLK